jgi:hypothetical protein
MPLQRCTSGDKSGWRWGSKGKCYTGPDAKKKALKQGYAANPEEFASQATDEEIHNIAGELTVLEKMSLFFHRNNMRDTIKDEYQSDSSN